MPKTFKKCFLRGIAFKYNDQVHLIFAVINVCFHRTILSVVSLTNRYLVGFMIQTYKAINEIMKPNEIFKIHLKDDDTYDVFSFILADIILSNDISGYSGKINYYK